MQHAANRLAAVDNVLSFFVRPEVMHGASSPVCSSSHAPRMATDDEPEGHHLSATLSSIVDPDERDIQPRDSSESERE